MGRYANTDASLIHSGGGAVRVTLAAGVGQGNGGTSLECAGCWVQADSANTSVVRVNIGSVASANLGVELGRQIYYDGTDEAAAGACQPLWIPIDDVSKLYFYSADADAEVQITYLSGT